MSISVDQELCISCGACIDTCPEVFDWNEDDKAHTIVDDVPADMEEQAQEAADSCPTDAIILD